MSLWNTPANPSATFNWPHFVLFSQLCDRYVVNVSVKPYCLVADLRDRGVGVSGILDLCAAGVIVEIKGTSPLEFRLCDGVSLDEAIAISKSLAHFGREPTEAESVFMDDLYPASKYMVRK